MEEIEIAEWSIPVKAILKAHGENVMSKQYQDASRLIANGKALQQQGFPSSPARQFSMDVCNWGGGQRVWARLRQHNGGKLGARVAAALQLAARSTAPGIAVESMASIKGLGVSFASKHLRMLAPTRFAVLDSVLSTRLGYAMNPSGYSFFMSSMHAALGKLAATHLAFKSMSVAEFEQAVYVVVKNREK